MSSSHGTKDLYKVLKVGPNASKTQIKDAYRKLAMALHPDMHDGCENKTDQFKDLTEAYDTLSDHGKRTAYDSTPNGVGGVRGGQYNKNRRRPPPKDYRKVYTSRPPPGFNTFDRQRHFDMHYGDGMMHEAVDGARKRYERASKRFETQYHYQSPLGKGFTFDGFGQSDNSGNPYSKKPQGPEGQKTRAKGNPGKFEVEYEEGHYFDLGSTKLNESRRVVTRQETLKDRMEERKKNRIRRRGDPPKTYEEEGGCAIM
uniref:J domain-containing protein n=1 Tax=Odontella aurita TaxID=265563 RepID=A0A6U6BXU8_9STRA|mmetsp:Transcript_1007/g.2898  ORF Transcript_1007/g.2898 Transcript_1007/m.2898 type:complete len:257 (+) Transcript_1007:379-1149(+)|eukprot:CAMPEP_0113534530 /NCGR_PEP_ID=MMETSP0015_2-20120614/5207_1 /TAXON_ID=2838 /ORGANISM="Odontella" /LENGTH=256 /DNA_ID=CAMNT_0000433695 /DNA_START=386 /DNA_END=1156 /DNA_ORIENTATION=- /assembly_acc=CAM_ASM_000160